MWVVAEHVGTVGWEVCFLYTVCVSWVTEAMQHLKRTFLKLWVWGQIRLGLEVEGTHDAG